MYIKNSFISCGIITSYIYTVIYVSSGKDFYYFEFIKNNEFHYCIFSLLDDILNNFKIDFFVVFAGPAPLLSCRSTLTLMQAIFISKNIDIVLLQGYEFYKYDEFDCIIIQNFSGQYTLIEKNKIESNTFSKKDIENKDFFNKKIGLVSRENHSIKTIPFYNYILYPNIKKILQVSNYKYQLKKIITKVIDIRPYL